MPARLRFPVLAVFVAIEGVLLLLAPRLWWLPLLLAIAIFALLMTIRSEVELEGSVIVDRSPPEVWTFITDPSHIPLWNPRIVDVRLAGPLPLEVGSTYTYSVQGGRRPIPCNAEVLEREEGVMQRTRARIGPILSVGTHRVERDGQGTRLTASTWARVPLAQALVMRSVGPRRIVADLARLKAAVEAAP